MLSCLCTFLDALDLVTSAQQGAQDAGAMAAAGAQEQAKSQGKPALCCWTYVVVVVGGACMRVKQPGGPLA